MLVEITCPYCKESITFSNILDVIACIHCTFIGVAVYDLADYPTGFAYVHDLRTQEDYNDIGECISA